MSRVPKAKQAKDKRQALKNLSLGARPGRLWAAAFVSGLIAVMFVIHQTQIDGAKVVIRAFAVACAIGFGVMAWYLGKRAARRGEAVRIDKTGIGLAIGFGGWLEVPWDGIAAYRYWEPTGLALLWKRRQPRWVGFKLKDESVLKGRPWDEALDLFLARLAGRPALVVLHTNIDGSILDVLEACQIQRRDLDDPEGKVL